MAPWRLTSQAERWKGFASFLNTELRRVVGENKGLSEHILNGTPTCD